MPPHLHPRSRMTSSLFATTVIASFLVVALPHMLPCPAPRVKYADSEVETVVAADGTKRRRRRRCSEPAEVRDGMARFEGESGGGVAPPTGAAKRECPVPKPWGVIGELMGFGKAKSESEETRTGR